MKRQTLLITAALFCTFAAAFAQTPTPTPETFAYVTDGAQNFALQWDAYQPDAAKFPPPWHAVLVIFGGRFSGGTRHQVDWVAADLASRGFAALSIDYRTDGGLPGQQNPVYAPPAIPNQPGDVKLAVMAARTGILPDYNSVIYGKITGQVGAVGGSSGASHALWCAASGTDNVDKLDAAVLLSGAYELDDRQSLNWQPPPDCPTTYCGDVTRYCQTTCSQPSGSKLHGGSPIYLVDANVSPLYFVSATEDHITPYQFFDLKSHLQHIGVTDFVAVWQTGCEHSFPDFWSQPDLVADASAWLKEKLDASP